MEHIALLILGIFIAIIGIVNIMGNISTIHSYNRRKVREEVLLPERDHLQQDVLNLGAENLVDAERTLDLGLQLAVLKVLSCLESL